MTPEEESDALLDALAAGELPDSGDPAARVLAALVGDVLDQRRSSVSMTPST
ncbi:MULTISPECIES: hypothetical protein [Nonomuraea]|uniref:hypothetical protein n=1 Tax=Nonomuraea TaxID=83681 RepID=UPI0012E24A6A|nr:MULTISPECIES: hypothetical protein [Nonomuraea]